MDADFREFIGENALSIDLINIAPLDDLHQPKGIIKQAQDLAAQAFGADHTFFSVQGTSGAIMTMVMTVCGPGDKIIVPRNVHKSVMSAIVFSGAVPVFINPEIDKDLGISHGITLDAVEKTLKEHSDAKGLLVINPTYFGISADLQKSSKLPIPTKSLSSLMKHTESISTSMRTCPCQPCRLERIWPQRVSINLVAR